MNTGIKPNNLESILDVLSKNERVEGITIFGSRALGNFRPASDIDIALTGSELTLTDQAELSEKLEKLPIPQFVDLLRYNAIESAELIEHINTKGITLWTRTNHQDTISR